MRTKKRTGFTLVELVVVIVIIGILAAVAIPRLSRGSVGASQSAVMSSLATVRGAISIYAAEHNGALPGPDATGFNDKLTKFTDVTGTTVSATKTATAKYGPYLQRVPPCPVGENAGKTTANKVLIDATNSPPTPVPGGGEGWVYNPNTGEILPNSLLNDDAGQPFSSY